MTFVQLQPNPKISLPRIRRGRYVVVKSAGEDGVISWLLVIRLLVTGLAEGGSKPLKTLVQTISRGSAGGLDVLLGCISDQTQTITDARM